LIVLSFLALLPRICLGFFLAHFIWRSAEGRHLLVKSFLAAPLGIGISSLAGFLWLWAGLPLMAYAFVETGIAIILTACLGWLNHKAILEFYKKMDLFSHWRNIWFPAAMAGLLVFAAEFFMSAWQNPHGRVDAWVNWNVAARFIYAGGDAWTNTFLRIHGLPDYPLLLAMSNSITWSLLGRESIRGPLVLCLALAFSTFGLLFSYLNLVKGRSQAWLGLLILATQPIVAYHAMNQLADSPLAAYFLASGGLILVYFSCEDRQVAILSGLLAGLSAWTKNEGLGFMIVSGIAWGLIAVLYNKSVFRSYMTGLAVPLLVVILFKTFLAPQSGLFTEHNPVALLQDVERYWLILGTGMITLLRFGNGVSLLAVLGIYALLVGRSRQPAKGIWLVMTCLVLQVVTYFFIYLTTPYDLTWHLSRSADRLIYHLVPLGILCLFSWLSTPDELKGFEQGHAPHH
jgi:hypothetical protein